jgi:hypothetical protein
MYGDISESGDASGNPGKSSLFFLTVFDFAMESDYPAIWQVGWQSRIILVLSGAFSSALENPLERFICTPGRTHNRIRSPR